MAGPQFLYQVLYWLLEASISHSEYRPTMHV